MVYGSSDDLKLIIFRLDGDGGCMAMVERGMVDEWEAVRCCFMIVMTYN